MTSELTLFIAFTAGIVSFISPCVLPIIPGFLAYLAGTSLRGAKKKQWAIFMNSVLFVLGFSSVFALIGIILTNVLVTIAYDLQIWLARIGGTIIIFFGLYLIGLIRPQFMEMSHEIHVEHKFHSHYLASFVFGAAFAVGWSPCVGAIMGSIFALATIQPGSAFLLLFTYSLGLGLPFLIVGAFTAKALKYIHKYEKYIQPIETFFGFILIALGMLIITNKLVYFADFEVMKRLVPGF